MSARPPILRRAPALFLGALLAGGAALPACAPREGRGAGAEVSARAELAGTVLDARTGAPVVDARVTLPGERVAQSDARGRFLVRDLPAGLAGEVLATAPDGRRGRVELRPLRAGRLEVVLHVAP